jgi:hypothetical protein
MLGYVLLFALAVTHVRSGAVRDKAAAAGETHTLFIREKGTYVRQQTTVDEAGGLVRVVIPPHNAVRGSTFLHDFTDGLTARYDADQKRCYITEMTAFWKSVTPQMVLSGMRKAQGAPPADDVQIMKTEWSAANSVAELADDMRRELRSEIQELCHDVPITLLNPIKEIVSVGVPFDDEAEVALHRVRRQIIPEDSTCAPGMQRTNCYHSLRCEYVFVDHCDPKPSYDKHATGACLDINKYHQFYEDTCCVVCCEDPLRADSRFPACNDIAIKAKEDFAKVQCVDGLKPRL